ncbi:hypothetical protein PHG31p87 [Aeromonas phage 31]|uniref:Uncharacterized protein PHG31ORF088c n=1 Tax=Aeromonas phage 31 TaxID=321023 RepID=Q56ES4_9CAUD|nr:hypothetical protein PHG31p87 [Aeromonas phage 31]AAX63576.1 hypothetical protein PHG31p87 [Aeromonas phage 31]APU00980.1 hypothetical protein [Aeromonas phage 31.2]
MKTKFKMPTSGQFVAVWIHNRKPWADTFKWCDGVLKVANEHGDFYETVDLSDYRDVFKNAKFLMVK